MGMFDNIKVEMPLPELPEAVVSRWGGKASDVVFQTKDTSNQALSTYKIDANGVLHMLKQEGYWTEQEEVAENASFSEKMAAMPHFVVESEHWAVEYAFSGAINFYESYTHHEYQSPEADYDSDEWKRFESGWVEYCGLFKHGQLVGNIELIKHTPPKKLTDEELAERLEDAKIAQAEWEKKFKESRKKYPTTTQKLIDNIDRELKLVETIMDEEDNAVALSNIRILIKEYREKHDKWFE